MIKITVFKTSKGFQARVERNGITTHIKMWEVMDLPSTPTPRELKSAVVWAGFSESIAVHSGEVLVEKDVATWTDEREFKMEAKKVEHDEVLRDQIAMHAISGAVLYSGNTVYEGRTAATTEKLYDILAKRAYELADAMLKAREA